MNNPFFKNNGPFKFSQVLKELGIDNNKDNEDLDILDINDLQYSKSNEITFFHSKKYKEAANKTKASFCITTKNLQNELPKNCTPIIVDNVLVSTSIITAKFYPDSINDNFDQTVEVTNNTKFNDHVEFGNNVLLGKNVSIG
jgi:UDP-3-O-[3-hydroxymyristoyl] glucosamine N-acyltransferase